MLSIKAVVYINVYMFVFMQKSSTKREWLTFPGTLYEQKNRETSALHQRERKTESEK